MTGIAVVRHLKGIFARHGIPEVVFSDNGTQFSPNATSVFDEFAKEYGFKHLTSSPKYPQSNGFAECAVKIVKKAIKKNADVNKALLEYRATPLANGYSPAELLFGRRVRTTLPCSKENLMPKSIDVRKLREFEEHRREQQKRNFDRRHGAKEKPEFSQGEKVRVRDRREWGVVVEKASSPRSYIIRTSTGTFRRNAFHLESVGKVEDKDFDVDLDWQENTPEPPEQVEEPEAQQEQPQARQYSRYGRRYKPTERFQS